MTRPHPWTVTAVVSWFTCTAAVLALLIGELT